MQDLIFYWTGALVVVALLTVATFLLGKLAYHSAEDACKDILRFRRLAWLRYWSERLERNGLMQIDDHYREVSRGQRPADVNEAAKWEQSAAQAPSSAKKEGQP